MGMHDKESRLEQPRRHKLIDDSDRDLCNARRLIDGFQVNIDGARGRDSFVNRVQRLKVDSRSFVSQLKD